MKRNLELNWPDFKEIQRYNINTTELWMLKEMLGAGLGKFTRGKPEGRCTASSWVYDYCTVVIDETRWQIDYVSPRWMSAHDMRGKVYDMRGNLVDDFLKLKNRVHSVQRYKKKVE